jgi:hypothetical protein
MSVAIEKIEWVGTACRQSRNRIQTDTGALCSVYSPQIYHQFILLCSNRNSGESGGERGVLGERVPKGYRDTVDIHPYIIASRDAKSLAYGIAKTRMHFNAKPIIVVVGIVAVIFPTYIVNRVE